MKVKQMLYGNVKYLQDLNVQLALITDKFAEKLLDEEKPSGDELRALATIAEVSMKLAQLECCQLRPEQTRQLRPKR